ncbi:alanine racemase [Gloeocapsa sp. PCC 73106]|uniref:alanine racemase n=1 Tax=Gloeocapsa sp. PCC 73106 TaxID=102232 RepID=UPI0002E8436C|nr:alanine racemase [Gloeocapsa sp. PCC 73106]
MLSEEYTVKDYLDSSSWLSQLSYQRAWVEIDHSALIHNVQEIKKILGPKTALMGVVKADAYGHGNVAQTLLDAGCSSLAVATLNEGIELRKAGITASILLLGATNTPAEIKAIALWDLEPTLCDHHQALLYSDTLKALGATLRVHLKLDTGMSRLGVPWYEATSFASLVQRLPGLEIASIYSHLATADDPNPQVMSLQQERYEEAIAQLNLHNLTPPCLHLANSAATLSDRTCHYDLVRVGLALYGLYPAAHLRKVVSLRPVLQVKARVTQVKTIPPGTGVSYGHQFISDRSLRIAVVGIGYADGVPRRLSQRLQVLLRGQLVSQIGAITMDQLMLDVSAIPDLQVGEVVTLLGKQGNISLEVDQWASLLGTISWEILCGFKNRLPRVNQ